MEKPETVGQSDEMLPTTIEGDSISDTEPRSLKIKNPNIQGIFGLEPGDADPDYHTPRQEGRERIPPSRAFEALTGP